MINFIEQNACDIHTRKIQTSTVSIITDQYRKTESKQTQFHTLKDAHTQVSHFTGTRMMCKSKDLPRIAYR